MPARRIAHTIVPSFAAARAAQLPVEKVEVGGGRSKFSDYLSRKKGIVSGENWTSPRLFQQAA